MIRRIRRIVALAMLFGAQLISISLAQDVAPFIVAVTPLPGPVVELTEITVQFSEPVGGVEASNLLINAVPADSVMNSDSISYTFLFPQPALDGAAIHVT